MTRRRRNGLRIFLNGRLVPAERAGVSVYDRGFLYGDGVFETLRAYDGRIFKVREHLSRLEKSARALRLTTPFSRKEWGQILIKTLRTNRLQNAYIRITVSRGPGLIGLEPRRTGPPTVVVMAHPFRIPPERLYREGVMIMIAKTRKTPSSSLNARIKSLNYLSGILARFEAAAMGAYEAILLSEKGYLCEGTVSNLFWVRRGRLYTPGPACDILGGITRHTVLDLARKAGIKTVEGIFHPQHLLRADECFLTNTSVELMPVVGVFGRPGQGRIRRIGKGHVGPLTLRLRAAYQKLVEKR